MSFPSGLIYRLALRYVSGLAAAFGFALLPFQALAATKGQVCEERALKETYPVAIREKCRGKLTEECKHLIDQWAAAAASKKRDCIDKPRGDLAPDGSHTPAGERHLQRRFCEVNLIYLGEVSGASLFCNADDTAMMEQRRILEDAGCSASESDLRYFLEKGIRQFYAEEKAKGEIAVCGR